MRRSNAGSSNRSRPARWGEFQESAELQPHRSRYWLNAKHDDPEAFSRQVEAVCVCYLAAPQRWEADVIHTVSVDEMTGIQALERIAPTDPMKRGQVVRREFESTRHGT